MIPTWYRALAGGADIEVRSGGDGRTIAGIMVPWNVPIQIDRTLTEEFLPGAFNGQVNRAANGQPPKVPLAREHLQLGGTLIGRVTAMWNDKKGLYGEARVSPTPAGDETLALLRDGALSHLSIGFSQPPGGTVRSSSGVTQRRTSILRELAVVLGGAYGDRAAVEAVRSMAGTCPECGFSAVENAVLGDPIELDSAESSPASMCPPDLAVSASPRNLSEAAKLWRPAALPPVTS